MALPLLSTARERSTTGQELTPGVDASSLASLKREARRYLGFALVTTAIALVVAGVYAGLLVADFTRFTQPGLTASGEGQPLVIMVSRTVGGPGAWLTYARAVAHIRSETGRPVKLVYSNSWGDTRAAFERGTVEAAFSCNSCFIEMEKAGLVVPLVSPVLAGSDLDRAVLLVRAGSPYRSLDDLAGARVAVVSGASLGGHAFLYTLLAERHQTPEEFFGEVVAGASQELNLMDVLNGRVDATVVNVSLLGTHRMSEYRVLAQSQPFSLAPFVVSSSMPASERGELLRALLSFKNTADPGDADSPEAFVPYRGIGRGFLEQLKAASDRLPAQTGE